MITHVLRRGEGPRAEVAEWQHILGITSDGVFGRDTERHTIRWQLARGLVGDGVVGNATITRAKQESDFVDSTDYDPPLIRLVALPGEPGADRWPFLQAATWKWVDRKDIRLIVMHTMESPEKPDVAEAVAAWFSGRRGAPPKASAHFCCDEDSGVRCVLARHQAAAAPGANADGYHIEHAGRARQSAAEWADVASVATLSVSAEQAACVARMFGIPLRRLSVAEVADKSTKGFCGHIDVTRAFKKSDHVDPGSAFPWDTYLPLVADWQKAIASTAPPGPAPGA